MNEVFHLKNKNLNTYNASRRVPTLEVPKSIINLPTEDYSQPVTSRMIIRYANELFEMHAKNDFVRFPIANSSSVTLKKTSYNSEGKNKKIIEISVNDQTTVLVVMDKHLYKYDNKHELVEVDFEKDKDKIKQTFQLLAKIKYTTQLVPQEKLNKKKSKID